jgi:pimeloyl-ACP methyl ester carboxylesterase
MQVFYLHGFASSAHSTKAAYFRDRLRSHGVTLRCPDFNEPDFASLTMTRMLGQMHTELGRAGAGPVVLIGSSLGAVVAIHTAAEPGHGVDRLVLLAPALRFPRDAGRFLGAQRLADWRRTGAIELFHYGSGGMRRLDYAFYEDSLRYDAFAVDLPHPVLVFQGRRDEAVDYLVVEEYARTRSNVTLRLLDDDHQLIASLPRMWDEIASFIGLTR